MTLLIADQGPLSTAIRNVLERSGHGVDTTTPDDSDLFARAMAHEGIVYVASASLLDGVLAPRGDPERAAAVVGASFAPGVRVVVFVLPTGAGYDQEAEVPARRGRPYMIVKAPLLVEDVAAVLQSGPRRRVWVPRMGKVQCSTAERVALTAANALDDERQGRTVEVASDLIDVEELFQRASVLAGGMPVHGIWPGFFRTARPLARAVLGPEPPALALIDKLAAITLPQGAARDAAHRE